MPCLIASASPHWETGFAYWYYVSRPIRGLTILCIASYYINPDIRHPRSFVTFEFSRLRVLLVI
jgi:hypothetical protein